jgi:hypothetical protein
MFDWRSLPKCVNEKVRGFADALKDAGVVPESQMDHLCRASNGAAQIALHNAATNGDLIIAGRRGGAVAVEELVDSLIRDTVHQKASRYFVRQQKLARNSRRKIHRQRHTPMQPKQRRPGRPVDLVQEALG